MIHGKFGYGIEALLHGTRFGFDPDLGPNLEFDTGQIDTAGPTYTDILLDGQHRTGDSKSSRTTGRAGSVDV